MISNSGFEVRQRPGWWGKGGGERQPPVARKGVKGRHRPRRKASQDVTRRKGAKSRHAEEFVSTAASRPKRRGEGLVGLGLWWPMRGRWWPMRSPLTMCTRWGSSGERERGTAGKVRESQKCENVKEAKISDTSLTDIGVTG